MIDLKNFYLNVENEKIDSISELSESFESKIEKEEEMAKVVFALMNKKIEETINF